MTENLTPLELLCLRAVVRSARGNGYDFGFTSDVVTELAPRSPKATGALLTSLQSKGWIRVHEPVRTDSGTYTQITFVDTDAAIAKAGAL